MTSCQLTGLLNGFVLNVLTLFSDARITETIGRFKFEADFSILTVAADRQCALRFIASTRASERYAEVIDSDVSNRKSMTDKFFNIVLWTNATMYVTQRLSCPATKMKPLAEIRD